MPVLIPLLPHFRLQTEDGHENAIELIRGSALPWLLNCLKFETLHWFPDWRLQSLEITDIPKGTCSKCKIPEFLIQEVLS